MDKPDYYLEPTIQALVDVFGFDGNELRGLIQERPKQAYLRYKNGRQLSYDQKSQFEETEKERNAACRFYNADTPVWAAPGSDCEAHFHQIRTHPPVPVWLVPDNNPAYP